MNVPGWNPASGRAGLSLTVLLSLALVGCGGETEQAQSADAPAAAQTPPAAPNPEQDLFDLRELGVDEGSVMTSAIGVIDFSDFGCIYCANFHVTDYPALYDEFVVTGDVLWKYVPISIGNFPNGDLAGISGICADILNRAEGFAQMRDHLFEQRDEWLQAPAAEAPALFISYARTLGLDEAAFTACLEGDQASGRLERNNEMARQVGVTATPTFIVQGSPVRGAPPLADFQNALRNLVAQSRGQAAPEGENAPGA